MNVFGQLDGCVRNKKKEQLISEYYFHKICTCLFSRELILNHGKNKVNFEEKKNANGVFDLTSWYLQRIEHMYDEYGEY